MFVMTLIPQIPAIADQVFEAGVGVVVYAALIFVMAVMVFGLVLMIDTSLAGILVDLLADMLTRILDSRVATTIMWVLGCLFLTWVLILIGIFMF